MKQILVIAFAVALSAAPVSASNKYEAVEFADTGNFTITQTSDSTYNYIIITSDTGNGLQLRYPTGGKAPTIHTKPGRIAVKAAAGWSFNDGQCFDNESLTCDLSGCSCEPSTGAWCDSVDEFEIPATVNLMKYAGC